MSGERWQDIKAVFLSALSLPPDERENFLDVACQGNDSLRAEVENLIRADEQGGSFMESPPGQMAAEILAADSRELEEGQAFGPYKIISAIGAGGMGQVYQAHDLRLNRRVALKVFPITAINDRARLQRFKLEAHAASALNHPNIITIHEVGVEGDKHFIATELVEGETLRRKLRTIRFDVGETLDIANQIVAALDVAHRSGIIHRDIKPENIMVREDGLVKVLDFGLAKLTEQRIDESSFDTEATTRALVQTTPGMLLGTASYMSPEQARGLEVDRRTDIFSVGVVIYEMICGRQPFEGATTSDVIAAILKNDPTPLKQCVSDVPRELDHIVGKAMRKEREKRYQDIGELLIDLKVLKEALDFKANLDTSGPGLRGEATPEEPRVLSRGQYVAKAMKWPKAPAVAALTIMTVIVAGLFIYFGTGTVESSIESIAVLPFENQNTDTEYLSDGLTESIINDLSRLPALRVIARNSVFRYKDKKIDLATVGRELHVRAVLTGRIVQHGEGLTVSVELTDLRHDKQIWGERYNRNAENILAIQHEISRDVSSLLGAKESEGTQRSKRPETLNPKAHQAYLQGRYHLNRRTKEGFAKAVEFFDEAIELDPEYAPAYAGLADTYLVSASYSLAGTEDVAPRARSLIMKAMEIDESLAEAHTSLASLNQSYYWDFPGAEREYKRAIELNPGYATAYQWYAEFLSMMGRPEEAIAQMRRAEELDPLSLIVSVELGEIFHHARQYERAIEHYQTKTLELDPNFWRAHGALSLTYAEIGKYDEALAETETVKALFNHSNVVAAEGYILAKAGKVGEARAALNDLKRTSKDEYVSAYWVATVHAALGETDKALMLLEEAYQKRSEWLLRLKTDPRLDNLRSDSRFQSLLQRVGFSP